MSTPDARVQLIELIKEGILLRLNQIHIWKQEVEMLWSDKNDSYRLMDAKRQHTIRVTNNIKTYEQEVNYLEANLTDTQLSIAGEFLRFNMR
jgi:hypothetical protein